MIATRFIVVANDHDSDNDDFDNNSNDAYTVKKTNQQKQPPRCLSYNYATDQQRRHWAQQRYLNNIVITTTNSKLTEPHQKLVTMKAA